MIGTGMMRPVIYLLNPNNYLITTGLPVDPPFPKGGMPLYTLILPNGHKAYLTTLSSYKNWQQIPATLPVLQINNINWNAKTANVKITKVFRAEEATTTPPILIPIVVPKYHRPVTSLWKLNNQQIHGPTIYPNENMHKLIYIIKDTAKDSNNNVCFKQLLELYHKSYCRQ
jgi:hypothetical protein